MKLFGKYIINPNTVLIETELNERGQMYSKVIEGKNSFYVAMHPKAVIDFSLQYYCSSLKGAIDGARSILGNISMPPIMIISQLDICWFPSCSPDRSDCIWFSLQHVQKTEKVSTKQTLVSLTFDHQIVINIKRERFEVKRQRASQLRYISSERSKRASSFYFP